MLSYRFSKVLFGAVLLVNVVYFSRVYLRQPQKPVYNEAAFMSAISYTPDTDIKLPEKAEYHHLEPLQKIAWLLRLVESDKARFWLANTDISQPLVDINPRQFLSEEDGVFSWANSPKLFYDPRFTLLVYLSEIRHQLQKKNPHNKKELDKEIVVLFAWSDWVDLTMLNEELDKMDEDRLRCGYLQSHVNKPTKHPDFCQNLDDVSSEDLALFGVLSKKYLPGFLVKESPMNKAPHRQAMLQGKSHLLTYQENPLSIVFLTKDGTYEAQVGGEKKRVVHSEMFENYLHRRGINANHLEDIGHTLSLSPADEFKQLLAAVAPRPLDESMDIFHMKQTARHHDRNASRQLFLETDSFNYRQPEVDEQIAAYEERLRVIEDLLTNELHFDADKVQKNSLTRHELNHYNGLKYADSFAVEDEPTYYKLATLLKDESNNDAGWHYEWRFFNGALRYLKEGWTTQQLEVREQIILERLLRNWFRFAEEKGIVSWIAHGPLLAWYWDGLMFPFDVDIDIQMPSAELNRLLASYNMTLVVEDVSEGYGKFLIDCSTFIHHRDKAVKDNHIDARFIDVDTGTYIDITGIGRNREEPPAEYDAYIREKSSANEEVQLYMDRRKHWFNYEKISPLKYTQLGGVPLYVPNDFMTLLNQEYDKGTTAYHFDGHYYVPCVRLWLKEEKLIPLFQEKDFRNSDGSVDVERLSTLVRDMKEEMKVKLLESNDDILIEYYLTHKETKLHEVEKQFLLDSLGQQTNLGEIPHADLYNQLTAQFKMGRPARKALFDYEYMERAKHG